MRQTDNKYLDTINCRSHGSTPLTMTVTLSGVEA